MIFPFKGNAIRITSPYGVRALDGHTENHSGYDIVGVNSSKVIAAVGGTVVSSTIITDKRNLTWEWGNYVCIRGNDDRYYYYCHLSSRAVKKGQIVEAGDDIGIMGNTGYSFGAHLHFEVRQSDRKTTISPEIVLGVPNKAGTYKLPTKSQLETDLDTLVSHGVINSPNYWQKNAPTLEYLPELIHNMAETLRKK